MSESQECCIPQDIDSELLKEQLYRWQMPLNTEKWEADFRRLVHAIKVIKTYCALRGSFENIMRLASEDPMLSAEELHDLLCLTEELRRKWQTLHGECLQFTKDFHRMYPIDEDV